MSHVHGNHGHHHMHGPHGHGDHGAAAANAPGQQQAASPMAGSTPAAQAQQPQQQAPVDTSALDKQIQALAANFHADAFNNQPAAAGVQAAPSTLASPVANLTKDTFTPTAAPATDSNLTDPILNIKGGGGLAGGVVAGGGSYLGQSGGGGLAGGVVAGGGTVR